jgi:hypothetical protein
MLGAAKFSNTSTTAGRPCPTRVTSESYPDVGNCVTATAAITPMMAMVVKIFSVLDIAFSGVWTPIFGEVASLDQRPGIGFKAYAERLAAALGLWSHPMEVWS